MSFKRSFIIIIVNARIKGREVPCGDIPLTMENRTVFTIVKQKKIGVTRYGR